MNSKCQAFVSSYFAVSPFFLDRQVTLTSGDPYCDLDLLKSNLCLIG